MIGPTVDKNIFDVGTLIANRYEVTRFIGSGSMGWVIQVIDKQLDDRVTALKFLYPHLVHDEVSSSRFRNEVVIAQGLSHPSIVRIHDLGRTEGGQFFISMEFVNGVSLKEFLLRQGRPGLKVSTAARIVFEIAQAIGYAHQNGVVHRDLKPDNIIISDLGAVKLVDFGIARSVWQEHGLTRTGGAVGTPYYMSPEQVNGETVDYRADIYALGIIAYELVSGDKPFTEDSFLRLAEQHLEQDIPHLCDRIQSVPAWYDEIIQQATRKNKEERYESALEIAQCIEQHIPPGVLSDARVKTVPGIVAGIPDVAPVSDIKKRTYVLIMAGLFVFLGAATGYWAKGGFSDTSVDTRGSSLLPEREYQAEANVSQPRRPAESTEKRTRVNKTTPKGRELARTRSELHAAVNHDDTAKIYGLLEAGAEVNVTDGRGDTPLLQAIRKRKIDAARILLENGADPNILNNEKMSVLELAIRQRDKPAVKLLIDYGADTGLQISKQNVSLLHLAIRVDSKDIVSMLLLQEKTNPNYAKHNGVTPLHFAARYSNDIEIVSQLIAAGADVNRTSEYGRSPIYTAIEHERLAIVEALVRGGADINVQDQNGYTPLIYAVRRKKTDASDFLLSLGADKTLVDKRGKSALDYAVSRGNARQIDMLK